MVVAPMSQDPDLHSRKSILLLSIHVLLKMALRDLVDLGVTILKAPRRDLTLESTEDDIPVFEKTINDIKRLDIKVREEMLAFSGSPTLARAQDALDALASPNFSSRFTWGVDQVSLDEIQMKVTWFHQRGHVGFAYVLRTRLLQLGITHSEKEIEDFLLWRQQFKEEMDTLTWGGHSSFSLPIHWRDCQVFAPREVVRILLVAKQILADRRPDFLRRFNYHILSDAGFELNWERPDPVGFCRYVHLEIDKSASVHWPSQAIDNTDILGRTALHIAVRQASLASVITLSQLGANLHQVCLNGLSMLHIAASHGHTCVLNFLVDQMEPRIGQIQYTHHIDQEDELGRTAFWHAARGSHFEVMDFLANGVNLKHFITTRVNIDHEDKHRRSALAVAERDGRQYVLSYLQALRKRAVNTTLNNYNFLHIYPNLKL
ncbi:Ankyrin repeat and death domain-containing protein 1A [Nothophoma quercina]|uniref:Ankyrin repeat and death domain-containing protein 1A n=1 Tax=Nothophoma quercina TaxID=749835 RepID=A0ABR3QX77_9PLEO